MVDQRILTQFDASALYAETFALQLLIALFTVIALVLSLVFAVAITAIIALFTVFRIALLFVLSRRQTRATFAMLGSFGGSFS